MLQCSMSLSVSSTLCHDRVCVCVCMCEDDVQVHSVCSQVYLDIN